ncbi:hypothetical protein Gotur_004959 [Gossypium turneri]
MFMENLRLVEEKDRVVGDKKYKGPHTCAEDHPKMDSAMLASLILPTVKADSRTLVLVLIVNISSQMGYTPSYCKAWIAKQKALAKMHSGWDASYNEIWQWCQVLERYVLGYRLLLAMA